MEFRDQSSIEGQLRHELQQARKRYESAMRQFDVAVEEARQLGLTHPDGSHKMHKASTEFNHALHEYAVALKRFSQLILGTGPE